VIQINSCLKSFENIFPGSLLRASCLDSCQLDATAVLSSEKHTRTWGICGEKNRNLKNRTLSSRLYWKRYFDCKLTKFECEEQSNSKTITPCFLL